MNEIIIEKLIATMGGKFSRELGIDLSASDTVELGRWFLAAKRLKGLGKGIGDVTVNIFLRELRTVWPKARPTLSPPARLVAGHLRLIGPGDDPLAALEKAWSARPIKGADFCDLEAALVRLGNSYCKKSRHGACPFRDICETP